MTWSHVTGNPRWRPEVTSQIQDGGNPHNPHEGQIPAPNYSILQMNFIQGNHMTAQCQWIHMLLMSGNHKRCKYFFWFQFSQYILVLQYTSDMLALYPQDNNILRWNKHKSPPSELRFEASKRCSWQKDIGLISPEKPQVHTNIHLIHYYIDP